jgi:hypothetical protein
MDGMSYLTHLWIVMLQMTSSMFMTAPLVELVIGMLTLLLDPPRIEFTVKISGAYESS